jgi:uncharacterized protein YecT (DUF1311 family)
MMTIIVLLSAGVALGDSVPQCKTAHTTVEMEDCLHQELSAESRKLGVWESRVRNQLAQGALAPFDSAARAWRSYRDKECRAVYVASSDGSIAESAALGCKIELTDARLRFLGQLYNLDK